MAGMLPSSHVMTEEQEKALEVQNYRRKVQRVREEEYQEALIREREAVSYQSNNLFVTKIYKT